MWCNQTFSVIKEGVIVNRIVADSYTEANDVAKASYGVDAIAIDITLYPVRIDYTYAEGIFRDLEGNIIERNPTEAENIEITKAELTSTKQELSTAQSELIETRATLDSVLIEIIPELMGLLG